MKRGEIWWADLGPYRAGEQTGRRPVIVWQSDTLTRLLQSVLVVPLTTNLDRAKLAGTALVSASDGGLASDSVAVAFQRVGICHGVNNLGGSAVESKAAVAPSARRPIRTWARCSPGQSVANPDPFQMRAIPKERLKTRIRALSAEELAELELATDEAIGRVEPETGLE